MSETWLLNERFTYPSAKLQVSTNFDSNNEQFVKFEVLISGILKPLTYYKADGNAVMVGSNGTVSNTAYRTIVLSEPASGDFLTWLTANAVKQ